MHELRMWTRGCFLVSLALAVTGIVLLFFPATRWWGIVLLVIWPCEMIVYFYHAQEKA